MNWTLPRSWQTDDLVDDTMMNTHVRDNLLYLFSRPSLVIKRDNNATYSTTSTSFVDIDGTNLRIQLTTSGSALLVGFVGYVYGGALGAFDINIDGSRYAPGSLGVSSSGSGCISMVLLITGLAAGAHTFKVQWRSSQGSAIYLASGNGIADQDQTPAFWAVEVG